MRDLRESCRIAVVQAAREARAYVSIGVSERDAVNATLYNTNLIFSPAGELLTVHRKLKPTGAERVVWGDADRHYFPVAQTPWGPMASLICWESYMPLARVALYEKGITLYLSPNTNDNEEWQATIRHIAIEGHCFFVNCDMVFTRDMYPAGLHCPEEIGRLPDIVCRGGSCVVDPYGHYVTQPVWDREAIICADLDLTQVPRSRMEFDGCGHYARPDVLKLTVDDRWQKCRRRKPRCETHQARPGAVSHGSPRLRHRCGLRHLLDRIRRLHGGAHLLLHLRRAVRYRGHRPGRLQFQERRGQKTVLRLRHRGRRGGAGPAESALRRPAPGGRGHVRTGGAPALLPLLRRQAGGFLYILRPLRQAAA